MELVTETVVRAHTEPETIIFSFDGEDSGSIAIDENDNGIVVSVAVNREQIQRFCAALRKPPVEAAGEVHSVVVAASDDDEAKLYSTADGYQLVLSVRSERERVARFSYDEGALIRKAVLGSFGFWS